MSPIVAVPARITITITVALPLSLPLPLNLNLIKVPLVPEIALPPREPLEPAGQDPAAQMRRPVVGVVVVVGHDAAAAELQHDPRQAVEQRVANDAGDEPVGDRVREGHDGEGEESWDRVPHVPPVDVGCCARHHRSDQD